MSAIQNLEIVVDLDISEAVAKLNQLKGELTQLGTRIEEVDAIAEDGIDIATNLENVDGEIAAVKSKVEAAEQSTSLDIPMNVHDRSVEEILGRAGLSAGDLGPTDTSVGGGGRVGFPRGRLDGSQFGSMRGGNAMGTMGRRGPSVFERLRNSAANLHEKFGNLVGSAGMTNLRMSDIHNMMARLIPMLVVFVGTIPAAVTALWTLQAAAYAAAASLMAMVGFGALGIGLQGGQFSIGRIKEQLSRIKDMFIEAFAPLANRLDGLVMDAINGLDAFFTKIADQGDALMALTDEARAFGRFVMDFVPSALRTLAALVQSMSDVFGNIGNWLKANFASVVRGMVNATSEILPRLSQMVQIIGRALPAIVRMSEGFIITATAIMSAVGGFMRLLGLLGITPRMFGLVTSAVLGLVSAWALLNTQIAITAFRLLVSLGTRMLALISTYTGYSAASLVAAAATMTFARALLAVVGVVTLGLGLAVLIPVLQGIAGHFGILESNVRGATSALQEFDRVQRGMSGGGVYGTPEDNTEYAGAGSSTSGGGGSTTVVLGRTGNKEKDDSDQKQAQWRLGRTTGSKA